MFSGKTTELLRLWDRASYYSKNRLALVKYARDLRYGHEMATHGTQRVPALEATVLAAVMDDLDGADFVGIDEGQFFPDLVECCVKLADAGKTVVVAGLNGDTNQQPFESIAGLHPHADEKIFLTAVCAFCDGNASFTVRLSEGPRVEIGGDETYRAVCRAHLHTWKSLVPATPTGSGT